MTDPKTPEPQLTTQETEQVDDSRYIERLRQITGILEQSSLMELEYDDGEISVRLSKAAYPAVAAAPQVQMAAAAPVMPTQVAPTITSPGTPDSKTTASDPNVEVVVSPFVGTFYRSPSPSAKPFINEGDKVSVKQVLCIVEAMKLMNEIESEVSGRVVEILPSNGQPVQYGEPLFKIAID